MIKGYFGDGSKFGVNIRYNIEIELLGTGGAVKDIVEKYSIKDNFILAWGDNLSNFNISSMIDSHYKNEGLITMSLTTRDDVEHFGVAKLDGDKISGFVEKPSREEAPSNLINAGAFIINPVALNILPNGKSSIEKQCFELLSKEGKIYSHKHEGYWFPTDTLEKYEHANKEIGMFIKYS